MGAPTGDLLEARTAYMRYRGQGHEITVRLPSRRLTTDDHDLLQNLLTKHDAHFTRTIPNLNVEILSWTRRSRRNASSRRRVAASARRMPRARSATLRPSKRQAVDVAIYRRLDLNPVKQRRPGHTDGKRDFHCHSTNFKALWNALGEIELLRKES